MKKVLSILVVMFISITTSAQFVIYEPANVPQQSYSIPNLSFSDPVEEAIRNNAARAKARAEAMEIVSSEIITVDGFNYLNETYFPLKVKTIQRRNGQTEFYCLGIKKNGSWSACEKQIASLDAMYKQATDTSQKNTILELMEYGNYLLILSDSEIYIIK